MKKRRLFGLNDPTVGKAGQVNLRTDFAVRAKEKEQLFHKLRLLGSFDDDEDVKSVQGGRRGN